MRAKAEVLDEKNALGGVEINFFCILERRELSFNCSTVFVHSAIHSCSPSHHLRTARLGPPSSAVPDSHTTADVLYRRSPGCHRLESPNGRLALHFLAVRSRTFAEMKVVLVVNIAVELTVRYAPKRSCSHITTTRQRILSNNARNTPM